jgi:hypothetical protein
MEGLQGKGWLAQNEKGLEINRMRKIFRTAVHPRRSLLGSGKIDAMKDYGAAWGPVRPSGTFHAGR